MSILYKSQKPSALAFWTLDETSGTRYDITGNGYNLLDINNVGYDTGKINNGAYFDGTNHLNTVGSAPGFGGTGLTISFWVKTTSTWDNMLVDAHTGNNPQGGGYGIDMTSNGRLDFLVSYGPDYWFNPAYGHNINSNISINDGNWHHIVGTYDKGYMKLYIDGSLDSLNDYYDHRIIGGNGTNHLSIGSNSDGTYGNSTATIDAVGIWNYALDQNQINALYNNGDGTQDPNVVNIVSTSNSKIILNAESYSINKPKILSNYVAPFTPDQISGLYAWYDANDTATVLNVSTSPASDGEEVYTWLDKSGNGIDLTIQAAGYGTVYAPTLTNNTMNGKSAVRFTAIDQFSGSALRGEQTLGSSDFTLFLVFKWRDLHRTYFIDTVFTLGSEFGSGGEMAISSGDSNYGIYTQANGGTIIGTPVLNKPVSVAFNTNKTSLISNYYSNGSKIASTNTNTNPVDSPIILGSWVFNSGTAPEYFSDADIAEVIIYNTSLSDSDMTKVNRYIKNKYKIH